MSLFRIAHRSIQPFALMAIAVALWPLIGHLANVDAMFDASDCCYGTHETTSITVLLIAGAILAGFRKTTLTSRGLALAALVMVGFRFVPSFEFFYGVGTEYLMGANTAAILGAIALAVLLKSGPYVDLGTFIAFVSILASSVMLAAHVLVLPGVFGAMSRASASMSMLLGLATMMSRPSLGVLRVLLNDQLAGRFARRQVALAATAPALFGALFIMAEPNMAWRSDTLLLLASIAGFMIVLICADMMQMEHSDRQRRQLERQLADQALRDGLTNLFNRVMLDRRFARAVAQAERFDVPFSFLMIDLDHFKKINDLGGHELGDRVLRRVAREMRGQLRMEDTLARIGGEEFAALLPGATLSDAFEVAERLRRCVAGLRIGRSDGGVQTVTASVGVAQWHDAESLTEIYGRTDHALYMAKHSGRNRVIVADGEAAALRVDGRAPIGAFGTGAAPVGRDPSDGSSPAP